MGLIFDGISSKEIGIGARLTNVSQIPQLKNYFGEIVGRHGFFDFGNTFEGRSITILGTVFPQVNEAAFQLMCDKVSGWLNPERGLCKLQLDSQPDRFYTARLQSGVEIIKGIRHTGTFTLDFICPDPYGYAVQDETFTLLENTTFTRIKGNADSEPLYEIKGIIGNNGWIDISVNGETLRLFGPLLSGETLAVDAGNKTAVIIKTNGDKHNALSRLEPLIFPTLRCGNNSMEIVPKDAVFTSLIIKANSRWL